MSIDTQSEIVTPYEPKERVPANQARALSFLLTQFMYSYYGLNTAGFFDESSHRPFTLKTISLVARAKDKYEALTRQDFPHYWVFCSEQAKLDLFLGYKYNYFTAYTDAEEQVRQNDQLGRDSYLRGAAGSSKAGYNFISEQLYEGGLLRGIYIGAHEPLHPLIASTLLQLGYAANHPVTEGLIQFLSEKIIQEFLSEFPSASYVKTVFTQSIGPNLIKKLKKHTSLYFSRWSVEDKFTQTAALIMLREYALEQNQTNGRTPKQAARLEEIKEAVRSSFPTDALPELVNLLSSQINNAYLSSNYVYTLHCIVEDFFKKGRISTREFLRSLKYRKRVLPRLIKHMESHATTVPDDINRQWETAKKDYIDLFKKGGSE